MEPLDWRNTGRNLLVRFACLYWFSFGYYLACLRQKLGLALVLFLRRNVFTYIYMNSDFLKVQLSYSMFFTKRQGFNRAFLILWSSDLNCQCSCIYGTCINLLKYPSSYINSLLQSKVHTSTVAHSFSAHSVLGRIPLCIQLISSDCISFITVFHGSLNFQILILICFLSFFL